MKFMTKLKLLTSAHLKSPESEEWIKSGTVPQWAYKVGKGQLLREKGGRPSMLENEVIRNEDLRDFIRRKRDRGIQWLWWRRWQSFPSLIKYKMKQHKLYRFILQLRDEVLLPGHAKCWKFYLLVIWVICTPPMCYVCETRCRWLSCKYRVSLHTEFPSFKCHSMTLASKFIS